MIFLGRSKTAIIDAASYGLIKDYRWAAEKHRRTFYAHATALRDGRKIHLRMHNILLKAEQPFCVDHRNRNGLDNRLSNLRIVTASQNSQNQRCRFRYGRVGVTWRADKNLWVAQIGIHGQHLSLGEFSRKKDAIAARVAAEKQYFERR